MTEQAVSVPLDRDGKTLAPSELLELLRGAEGKDVEIDAAETLLLTSRHLQVLIASERRSQETDQTFSIINRSAQLDSCLALLGWQPNS